VREMGAGSIIAAIVAVAAILIAANVAITGGLYMTNTLTSSMKEVQDAKNEQLKTEIEISNITANKTRIDVTLRNTGHERIREYSQMDLIVHYHSVNGDMRVVWLPYTNGTPDDDEWAVTGISPDLINPDIFDPDEEMTIRIEVDDSDPMKYEYINWLQITTPNGVGTSKYFSG
jgi:flagellar protein FlaF